MLPFHIMVGVTGFEPAASTSQMSRATNCATPRKLKLLYHKSNKLSSTKFNKNVLTIYRFCDKIYT